MPTAMVCARSAPQGNSMSSTRQTRLQKMPPLASPVPLDGMVHLRTACRSAPDARRANGLARRKRPTRELARRARQAATVSMTARPAKKPARRAKLGSTVDRQGRRPWQPAKIALKAAGTAQKAKPVRALALAEIFSITTAPRRLVRFVWRTASTVMGACCQAARNTRCLPQRKVGTWWALLWPCSVSCCLKTAKQAYVLGERLSITRSSCARAKHGV